MNVYHHKPTVTFIRRYIPILQLLSVARAKDVLLSVLQGIPILCNSYRERNTPIRILEQQLLSQSHREALKKLCHGKQLWILAGSLRVMLRSGLENPKLWATKVNLDNGLF